MRTELEPSKAGEEGPAGGFFSEGECGRMGLVSLFPRFQVWAAGETGVGV